MIGFPGTRQLQTCAEEETRMSQSTENAAGEAMVQLSTRVPASLKKTLKLHCARHDLNVGAVVKEALETALAKAKKK